MQLVSVGIVLVKSIVYDSADISSAEIVASRLPPGTDERLRALISNVSPPGRLPLIAM